MFFYLNKNKDNKFERRTVVVVPAYHYSDNHFLFITKLQDDKEYFQRRRRHWLNKNSNLFMNRP